MLHYFKPRRESTRSKASEPKRVLTPTSYHVGRLWTKIRGTLPVGYRGDQKNAHVNRVFGVAATLTSKEGPPRLLHPIWEDDLDKRLERLEQSGHITHEEAEKIRAVTEKHMHI